jgi:hypothetical protein
MKKLIPALVCIALLAAACGLSKGSAQMVITAADEALKPVRAEASKYVPEQLAPLETALNDARASFAKGDYKGALAAAKDIPLKARDLVTAIEARKAELPKIWDGLAAEMPKLIASTKDAVAKAKGVDKAALATAKADVDKMPAAWVTAAEAFKSGDLAGAVSQAIDLKGKAADILTSIGANPQTAGK